MLINLRNALMAGKRLPYDAEVEYLESTGTQWIDTGVVPTNTTGVLIECTVPTNNSRDNTVVGARQNSGNTRYWIDFDWSTNDTFYFGFGSITPVAPNSLRQYEGERVQVGMNYQNDRICTVNGEKFSTLPISGSLPTIEKSIYCFRSNYTSSFAYSGKIFSLKITDGLTLVRDYIPVRVGTVGYLYDRVSGKLFGNAGSGDFVLGPDVVPVEYIESNGTEWIDTGVIGNSSTKLELKAQGANTSVYQTLCGGRDSNGLYGFSVWQHATLGGAYGVRWDYLSTNASSGSGYILDGIWNTAQPNLVVKDGANNYLNGVQLGANESNTFSCNFPLALFAMNTGGSKGSFFVGKMFMCKISNNNTPTRNYTPVRVGTEGAMMDVLTRRIYRNAGAGAFTYGNDLPYPIPA